jgi:hypothetical protein
MLLRNLVFEAHEVDNLVLAWLNRLSAPQIDGFFWDYTGPFGYSQVGYGLGAVVASRIARLRAALPDGFRHISTVENMPGIGPDKIDDMRVQAREALALAVYRGIEPDPDVLWERLYQEGPGIPLSRLLAYLKRYFRSAGYSHTITQVLLEVPFVALALVDDAKKRVPAPRQFLRIRTQPWAFVVHPAENWWKLSVESTRSGFAIQLRRAL